MSTGDFIKKHLGFILTMVITYVLGILLVVVQYVAIEDEYIQTVALENKIFVDVLMQNDKNLAKVLIDSLVPTTITYVLGCVLVNIAELIHNNSENCVYNLFTCLFVLLYAIVFCIYVMTGFSFIWVVIELICTLLLLYFNIMCYKEKNQHRNHNLT